MRVWHAPVAPCAEAARPHEAGVGGLAGRGGQLPDSRLRADTYSNLNGAIGMEVWWVYRKAPGGGWTVLRRSGADGPWAIHTTYEQRKDADAAAAALRGRGYEVFVRPGRR